ncbi:MAG: hypothetical protein KF914_21195 [Rhizobiaceae bacterium]|nr:hypothetical protein [Rhizobiaceae bacterium]
MSMTDALTGFGNIGDAFLRVELLPDGSMQEDSDGDGAIDTWISPQSIEIQGWEAGDGQIGSISTYESLVSRDTNGDGLVDLIYRWRDNGPSSQNEGDFNDDGVADYWYIVLEPEVLIEIDGTGIRQLITGEHAIEAHDTDFDGLVDWMLDNGVKQASDEDGDGRYDHWTNSGRIRSVDTNHDGVFDERTTDDRFVYIDVDQDGFEDVAYLTGTLVERDLDFDGTFETASQEADSYSILSDIDLSLL